MEAGASGSKAVLLAMLLFLFLVATVGEVSGQDESCRDCHAGQGEWLLAPDVYQFWVGRKDSQDGGHGDEDNLPGMSCTGPSGCHDLSAVTTHMNGVLETLGNPSENTFHLAEDFIATIADRPWSVAVQFNSTCAESCHLVSGVQVCIGNGHARRSPYPYTPRFGESSTPADADGSSGIRHVTLHVDSDISTNASPQNPDYVLCISCHDPHGTGLVDPDDRPNMMLRRPWRSSNELCFSCHMDVSVVDSDGDKLTDEDETNVYHTDPFNPDTDDDDLTDGEEVTMAEGGGCPDPLLPDSDGDMLPDGSEVIGGTSPCNPDSDEDGTPDYYDPYPTDPEGTQVFIEEELRRCSVKIDTTDLSLMEARNYSAASGKRKALAKKLISAANAVHVGDYQGALNQLISLLDKVDGLPRPGDWMVASTEKTEMRTQMEYCVELIQYSM